MKSPSAALALCFFLGAGMSNAWMTVPSVSATDLFYLQFPAGDTGYAVGSTTVLKTVDRGAHWMPQALGKQFHKAAFLNGTLGWAVSKSSTIYRTSNGGQQWDSLSAVSGEVYSIAFVDANRGWVVLDPRDTLRILTTTNGGSTWSPSFKKANPFTGSNGFYEWGQTTRTIAQSSDTGWVLAAYYGYYRFYTSTSGGMENGFGSGAILKTVNGGQTWTETALDGHWSGGYKAGNDTWFIRGLPTAKFTGTTSGSPLGCGHSCTYHYAPASDNRIKTFTNGDMTGSQTIIQASERQYLRAVHFRGKDTGIAVGTSGLIVRTINGGLYWAAEVTTGMDSLLDVKIVSGSMAFAVDGRLWQTDPSQPYTVSIGAAPVRKTAPATLSGDLLRYTLPYAVEVSVTIRELRGKKAWTHKSTEAPGSHVLALPLRGLTPGTYIVEFRAGGLRESLRFTTPR